MIENHKSGPKVHTLRRRTNGTLADGRSPLFRVHLPGHHVVSVFLFSPRPGTRPHLDRRAGSICALHVVDSLVRIGTPPPNFPVVNPPLTRIKGSSA
jgi:hypothetical protein